MLKTLLYRIVISVLLLSFILPVTTSAEEATTGTLTIHKYEQEPEKYKDGGEDGDGTEEQKDRVEGTPLEGVTYKVIQTHKYDGQNWTEVTDGKEYTLTTDDKGQASEILPLGSYSVEEIDGPKHVNLNKEKFSVDIPMTSKDGSTLNYDVHIYPKNETIRGDVELTKRDGDDKDKVLAGVQFELYHEDGIKADGPTVYATDENGKITVSNLAYGDYYFKEVKTIDGYLLGDQRIEFSIVESGTTVEVDVLNYIHPDVEKEIDFGAVNRGEIVTYKISVDLPGDIGEYKNFIVTDALHKNLAYVDDSANSPTGFTFNYDTDSRTLTWTGEPAALKKGTVEFTFQAKVSEDAGANEVINNKAIINYTNKHDATGEKETDDVPVTATAGSLTVIKQDQTTRERLAGAEFELRDLHGNVVREGMTTDENGELIFTELDFGDYELYETKAPGDYRKLTRPIDVKIDAENQFVTLTVDNSKSGWELPTTGGIGTILFTTVGLVLMSSATIAYFRRNKVAE
ncbi:SpaA isopeptide-forming pilin-related protein [Sporosarcina pasteurii]|uniref:Predicted outer membrane protein n=1 Tax=Sporosarcina pasteurii TaxID=1474 RepID=A0A380BD26_SPOPA|nr:SpaA isopeptide-forming pilin-related protein [Sporosarcina pasteurii]MDS9472631.1 SpaA isopeptide-forming pilin-related protein [Sporosarcina pasteurii]QBQ07138.1 isopeptide-forming domain-containing fimbrial protein [Sporosarcina pasteurii]SUI99262.1 Predicted outer membrane protein [Sporosarcina pasteurii]